jgi:hypothetical protein
MRKIVAKHVTSDVNSYIGRLGEIFYSDNETYLRISDGETQGAIPLLGDIEVSFDQSLNTFNDVEFNTVATESVQFDLEYSTNPVMGQLAWNAADGTLDVGLNGGDVVLQVGQETLYRVANKSGALIPNGTVVMAAGTTGNSGQIIVAPAIANGTFPAKYIMGIATEDIPNDDLGYVTHFGKVRGINTSIWPNGTILFADPAVPGGMTSTQPLAPNNKVVMAIVINSHAQVGTIMVRPSFSSRVGELQDVNQNGVVNSDLLVYNNGIWGTTANLNLKKITQSFSEKSGATGTVVHDCTNTSTFVHNTIAGNFTANLTNLALNSTQSIEVVLVLNQGVTPYMVTALQIAGAAQSINWAGGSIPSGNASKKDAVKFKIFNNSGVYTVLAELVTFG